MSGTPSSGLGARISDGIGKHGSGGCLAFLRRRNGIGQSTRSQPAGQAGQCCQGACQERGVGGPSLCNEGRGRSLLRGSGRRAKTDWSTGAAARPGVASRGIDPAIPVFLWRGDHSAHQGGIDERPHHSGGSGSDDRRGPGGGVSIVHPSRRGFSHGKDACRLPGRRAWIKSGGSGRPEAKPSVQPAALR